MNIKPLEIKQHFFATNHYIDEVDVRQLEANYKEAIEALIDIAINKSIYMLNRESQRRVDIARQTLEKVTGTKWSDLF